MTKVWTTTAFTAAILAGLALWSRWGSLVWLDAAIAFCS